jgi:Cation efflux family
MVDAYRRRRGRVVRALAPVDRSALIRRRPTLSVGFANYRIAVELASAGVLIWRLSVELRHGQAFSENAERTASRIAGALLFTLAAYVTIAALWSLWVGRGDEFSWPGFIVALIAIPAMRYLAKRKIEIADKLGSRALRADAMEAVTCGWLSFVVVIGLAAQWAVGAAWIDSVASLAIVWLLVKEGREAWAGEECHCG